MNSIKPGAEIFFRKKFVTIGSKVFCVSSGTFIGKAKHPQTLEECLSVKCGTKRPILLVIYWSDLLAYTNPMFEQ